MKIKAKDKWINFNVYISLLFCLIITIVFISSIITGNIVMIIILLLISLYFIVTTINGFHVINNVGIDIINDKIIIREYESVKINEIKHPILYPFCSSNHFGTMKFPTCQIIDINKIKKYGFIMDMKESFKYKTKFNIGIIDKDNNKYVIILNQFEESEIIDLIKYISKTTKLKPIGSLNDICK